MAMDVYLIVNGVTADGVSEENWLAIDRLTDSNPVEFPLLTPVDSWIYKEFSGPDIEALDHEFRSLATLSGVPQESVRKLIALSVRGRSDPSSILRFVGD